MVNFAVYFGSAGVLPANDAGETPALPSKRKNLYLFIFYF